MFKILSCIFFNRKYWDIYLHELKMIFESKIRNNENINHENKTFKQFTFSDR